MTRVVLTELERKALQEIRGNPGIRFSELSAALGMSQSRRVDRALQRLRRIGRVHFANGWHVSGYAPSQGGEA